MLGATDRKLVGSRDDTLLGFIFFMGFVVKKKNVL